MLPRITRRSAAALSLSVLGCGSDAIIEPETGAIEVSLGMTGAALDTDGCLVTIDEGTGQVLHDGESVSFSPLSVGAHTVTLSGLASNCRAPGGTAQDVTVSVNDTTVASFGVHCVQTVQDRIAFVSRRSGFSDIWVMEVDGSNPVNLTNNEEVEGEPAWSPDGSRIAFVRTVSVGDDYESDVWVMGADGSYPVNLTNYPGYDNWPAWSPDGTRIAFDTDRDGNREIYVMNADGSNPINLTNHEAGDDEPAWSPDGTQIALSSDRDGHWDLHLINVDGSNRRNVTNHPAPDYQPDWSPDGTSLVFGSYRESGDGIYTIGADGSGVSHVITEDCMFSPKWSPDGLQIAYAARCGSLGSYEILVVQVDGSNPVNLTDHLGRDVEPAWSPGS